MVKLKGYCNQCVDNASTQIELTHPHINCKINTY